MIDPQTQEFREKLVAVIAANAVANTKLAEAVAELDGTFDEGFRNLSAAIYKGLQEAGTNVAAGFANVPIDGGNSDH
jgi:hypothetical protein